MNELFRSIQALLLLAGLGLTYAGARAEITASHFQNAAAYSRAHGGLAFRVEQGGRLLYENYASGWSASTPHKIYSGTKSFFAVAAIIAEDDGLLTLNEKASDTLIEWRNDRRRAITIDELLSHTSGLEPSLGRLYPYRDQLAAAVRVPVVDTPGARFHYGGVNYQAFGEILRRKLRGKSLDDYLKERIFDPLNIDIDAWTRDGAGNPLVHSGLSLSAEEWAKFGDFINRARRGEPHRVLAESAHNLDPLFTGHAANPAYGLGFWLNRPPPGTQPIKDLQLAIDGDQLYPGGPRDLIAAIGSGHQMLYMIPSQDLVIVRFGDGSRYSDGDCLSRLLTGHAHPDARSH